MNSFKNINTLLTELQDFNDLLESGKLTVENLKEMLEGARDLHERVAIMQYVLNAKNSEDDAKEEINASDLEEVKEQIKEEDTGFAFKIETNVSREEVSTENESINNKEETERVGDNEESLVQPEQKKEENSAELNQEQEIAANNLETDLPASLNDSFKKEETSYTLAEKLSMQPIASLSSHIGLNQKFLFMNDLFEGENNHYNEAVNFIDNCKNYDAASEYLSKIKHRFNWDDGHGSVLKFETLVKRRFS